MAKELRKLTVKGKYAEAIIAGSRLDKEIKAKTDSLKEYKEILQDKTLKIEGGEQSISLQAEGSDVAATLTAARSVKMVATDDLKAALKAGKYSGVVDFTRTVKVAPADVDKVLAILTAAGVAAEDVWSVSATAAGLDKNCEKNGPDPVLGAAYTVEEVYKVKF